MFKKQTTDTRVEKHLASATEMVKPIKALDFDGDGLAESESFRHLLK